MIAALAGGVGAARLLAGMVQIADPAGISAIVNTGDDIELHGLHVSPDLDTVTYTLAGVVDPTTGWGLAGESWQAMDALDRYGGQTWFRLGDRDLATHMFRTQMLRDGHPLSEVVTAVAQAWGVTVHLLPMSDDPVRTRITLASGEEVAFQDYFVRLRHSVPITKVRFDGAAQAEPGPGVLAALDAADAVVVCPSNPVVSIGPILAIPGVRTALERRKATVVAVSPIVAGAAVKGPADRMLAELGHEPSAVSVAELYSSFAGTLVIDEADAALAPRIEATGLRCVVAPTIMVDREAAAHLARAALDAL
ncbi:MAG: 2-phospho-L-lactate transferase [Actinomycetota bacterium]|nr:2-phospho-L-lactate transferase [Actinomycetota bacterium]